jgi:hypothetical protein
MRTVSTWRCKCGTHIKVVGERDRTKPANTIDAACPKCGDRQIIYADKILTISDEGQSQPSSDGN